MKIAEILLLQIAEQDSLGTGLTKKKIKATEAAKDWKDSTPELGKVYCAWEIRLLRGQRTIGDDGKPCSPVFSADMGLDSMVEQITKFKIIPRAYQAKNAFSFFVGIDGSGPVSEDRYDSLPSNVVEISGRIAKLLGFQLQHEVRAVVAGKLNAYGKNTMNELKEIVAELAPPEPLEASDADEKVQQFDIAGNLGVMIAAFVRRAPGIVAECLAHQIQHLDTVQAKRVLLALGKANQQFRLSLDEKGERKFPDAMLQEWRKEIPNLSAPVVVVTSTAATPNASAAPDEEVAQTSGESDPSVSSEDGIVPDHAESEVTAELVDA